MRSGIVVSRVLVNERFSAFLDGFATELEDHDRVVLTSPFTFCFRAPLRGPGPRAGAPGVILPIASYGIPWHNPRASGV